MTPAQDKLVIEHNRYVVAFLAAIKASAVTAKDAATVLARRYRDLPVGDERDAYVVALVASLVLSATQGRGAA